MSRLLVGLLVVVASPATAHLDARDLIQLLNRQIEATPRDADLFLQRASAWIEREAFPRALEDVERARELGANPVGVGLVQARALLGSGRPETAEQLLTAALLAVPEDARVLHLRARARRMRGDHEGAAADVASLVAAAHRPSPELVLELVGDLRAAGRSHGPLLPLDDAPHRLGPSRALWREILALEDAVGRSAAALARLDRWITDELPQVGPIRSDTSFDVAVSAAQAEPQLTRGPYLQRGAPSSVVVRWRTSAAEVGRVRYGTSPEALSTIVEEATARTEHAVLLEGLAAQTAYYYSVGVAGQIHAGGDDEHRFVTPPLAGTRRATRLWVLGDSGSANADAAAVRDAFVAWSGSREPDLWLMLGDNAYSSGTDDEYQAAVFDTYPRQLRRQVLWSTLGNHDGVSADSALQSGPYYEIFTLPTMGEAGGVPSFTEAYYAFDWANVHFVVLDSHDSDRSSDGAMLSWLEDDLVAAVSAGSAEWIVAFWHHPPYTKGSHDSDDDGDSGGRMREMRENVLPLLEDWGVDLVLTGHSHSYERSLLLDGHYGVSDTFGLGYVLDGGDGKPDGDGPYVKPTSGPTAHEGAVYVVAGSSGRLGGGSLDHPAMLVGLGELGSLVVDVDGLVLEGTFLQADGAVGDRFTLVKGENPFLFVDGFERGDALRWSSVEP